MRSMDRKESCKCDTLSLKIINISYHKRTIIPESVIEGLVYFREDHHMRRHRFKII